MPEGDAETLALRIWELMEDRVRRLELAARGRQRVLRYFTQQQIALRYYQLYQAMLYGNVPYEPPPPAARLRRAIGLSGAARRHRQ